MHSEGKCSSVNFMQLAFVLPHASVFDQVFTPMMCNTVYGLSVIPDLQEYCSPTKLGNGSIVRQEKNFNYNLNPGSALWISAQVKRGVCILNVTSLHFLDHPGVSETDI